MITIKIILCPVDFFPASRKALKYAAALAASHNATLKVIHVVAPIISNAYPYPLDVVNPTGSMKKESQLQLKKLLASVKAEGVSSSSEVITGDIDLEIKRVIAGCKPDLIAMGTHGRRGFERWFIGSATERLLRHSPVPLLTVGDHTPRRRDVAKFRRILVTTDFSEGTADALEYAFAIARENDAHVTLLHIEQELPTEFEVAERAAFDRRSEEELLKRIPAAAAGWHDVDTRIEKGIPYQVILETIEKDKIDLLVMNIHGKGMLERALLGSTAERVVRAARCPVLAVPPMPAAKKLRARKRAA